MEERITWDEIDASPLLQLSCQERARLRETGDERFRAFWSDCFDAYQLSKTNGAGIDNKTNQTLDELEIDIGAFSDAFLNAFVTYQPNPEKPGQTFSIYLSSAVKHAQAKSHAADTSAVSRFNRETTRKVKAALKYMEKNGLSKGRVYNDPELLKIVADAANSNLGVKTLRIALQESQALLSLDDTEDTQTDLPDAGQEDVALQVEHKHMLSLLHRGIALMNLRDKEAFGKRFGLLLSSSLLGVLRCEDKAPPAENASDRLAACDEFRPMEKDNCLWDILLMRSYVDFTICPPHKEHTMDELPCAAMNPLRSPERLPHQDKTVAEFLGVSKAAISQRKRTMTAKLRALLDNAERSE